MRILSILLLPFLVIACNNSAKNESVKKDTTDTVGQIVTPPMPAEPDTIFTGAGTEPFWGIYVIRDQKILFHPADGPDVEVPYVSANSGTASINYNSAAGGNTIELNIVKKDCSDGMSEIVHSNEVKLVVNGTKYSGCGKWKE